jgi:predicted ATPase/DNA-binding SARP family transcriptional activator
MLGPFNVRIERAPLPSLRSRKGHWLLALLTMRGGQEVSRHWLAGTLWPEHPEAQALASLRVSLADLRHALGPHSFRLRAPTSRTLLFSIEEAWIDLLGFDRAVDRGDPASLEEAVRLYRGPLLEGCTEEWALQERQVRAEAYSKALETLAAYHLEQGNASAAVRTLRLLSTADPYRESARRQLIQALAVSGDYAAATLEYRELRLLLHRELNTAPSAETVALYERIRDEAQQRAIHSPPLAAGFDPDMLRGGSPPAHLPCPLTPFVGRTDEVRNGRERLASARLVTLSGSGGVGKTRLAVRIAEEEADRFHGDVWFIDLSPLARQELVVQAFAQALEVREQRGSPLEEALRQFIGSRQVLLVVDNCEHLRDSCARLVSMLLSHCPRLRILATSRQPLGLTGELVVRVHPMAVPGKVDGASLMADGPDGARWDSIGDPSESIAECDVVRLFTQRAREARSDFTLTRENAPAVAQVCRRLDGIPLAIELAAARVRSISVEELASRLENRFAFLAGGDRTRPRRHWTLRSAMDWSTDLLDEEERTLFRRLSIFAGGWTLAAAEGVCGPQAEVMEAGRNGIGGAGPTGQHHSVTASVQPSTLDRLDTLVDKSLVVVEERNGETRYRFLETVRQHAAQLLPADEREALAERHASFFAQLAVESEAAWWTAQNERSLTRLEADLDNLRAALQWLVEHRPEGAARMCGDLARFWYVRCAFAEGRAWTAAAVARTSGQVSAARAAALRGAGMLARDQADFSHALIHIEESVAIARTVGDERELAASLQWLGLVYTDQEEYARAHASFNEALALHRRIDNTPEMAVTLLWLAWTKLREGEAEEAGGILREALRHFRALGHKWGIYNALWILAFVEYALGRYAAASGIIREAMPLQRDLGSRRGTARSLFILGAATLRTRGPEAARPHLEEALGTFRAMGDKAGVASTQERLADLTWQEGDGIGAARLLGSAAGLREAIGASRLPIESAEHEVLMKALCRQLGHRTLCEAMAEGRALAWNEVVATELQADRRPGKAGQETLPFHRSVPAL